MPFLISENAVDSPSVALCCIYNAAPVAGAVITSPNVFFEKQNVLYYTNGTALEDVPCARTPVPEPPNGPCVTPLTDPLKRIIVTKKNKNVYINKQLFAVQGDIAQGLNNVTTDRNIVGPFKHPTIHISTKTI